jgi:hypothetical protein
MTVRRRNLRSNGSNRITLDDFEKESRIETKNEDLKQERKIVHPSKDNIPENSGTITSIDRNRGIDR